MEYEIDENNNTTFDGGAIHLMYFQNLLNLLEPHHYK